MLAIPRSRKRRFSSGAPRRISRRADENAKTLMAFRYAGSATFSPLIISTLRRLSPGLQADRKRARHRLALQRARDVDARRIEAEQARRTRRAERFRGGQKVNGLEQVGLPLPVPADQDVRCRVKGVLASGEVAEVLGGEGVEDHVGVILSRRSRGPVVGWSGAARRRIPGNSSSPARNELRLTPCPTVQIPRSRSG